MRSFERLPPDYHVRLTVHAEAADREWSAWLSRFWRKLKRRAPCEYLVVNEWSHQKRHVHILIRTEAALTSALVGALWSAVCPLPSTWYCDRVRSPPATARYVTKDLRDQLKVELPPATFKGRLVTYSRGFLPAPMRQLWDQLRAERFGKKGEADR
jgi:hypothetical protein